jgi:hypothetical protein
VEGEARLSPSEQRDHDERNKAATRVLIEGLTKRVLELEHREGGSLEGSFRGAKVIARGTAVVVALVVLAVSGISMWEHRTVLAQIGGLRSDYKLSTCVLTMTADERIEMRIRLAGRVTLDVREAMITYCPWLERDGGKP